jgi:hypothetical protein
MPLDPSDQTAMRTAVLGGLAVLLLAGGWFVLSWRVGHTGPGDAVGEALGVALGLLIALSVVGAIRSRHRSGADGEDDA